MNKDQLLSLTLRQLRQEASKLSVPLYSRKTKAVLVDLILKYQEKSSKKINISSPEPKFEETIDLLPSLDTRIVVRHTLIKDENMFGYEEEYAKIDEKAEPNWIEAKGYVHVGHSQNNLDITNMPYHDEILEFSNTLANLTGLEVLDDSKPSRVALIGKEKIPLPIPEIVKEFPKDLGIAPPTKHLPLV